MNAGGANTATSAVMQRFALGDGARIYVLDDGRIFVWEEDGEQRLTPPLPNRMHADFVRFAIHAASAPCIVCMVEPATVRLPCGHKVLCVPCTRRMLERATTDAVACPQCRVSHPVGRLEPVGRLVDCCSKRTFERPDDDSPTAVSQRNVATPSQTDETPADTGRTVTTAVTYYLVAA